MSEWRIDPPALTEALTNVAVAYEPLATVVTDVSLGAIAGGLTWGGGVTASVLAALNEVLEEQQSGNLTIVSRGIAAGIAGVGNSAWALHQGQEDLAATFQVEMAASAEDGDFSYFEANGYSGGA